MNWGPAPAAPQTRQLDPASQDGVKLLSTWYEAQAALRKAQLNEITLRNEVVAAFFPEKKEGTNNLNIPNNCKLKVVVPSSYEIKATDEQFDMLFLKFNQAGEAGTLLIDRLLKTEYTISKKEYDLLRESPGMEKFLAIIQPFVIKKVGQPQVSIEETKK